VSEVYQTIEVDRLLELLPFCSRIQLERNIVDAARNGQLQVRGHVLVTQLLRGSRAYDATTRPGDLTKALNKAV